MPRHAKIDDTTPHWHMLLAGGVLYGLIARLLVAWQPVDQLVGRVLADDAFYYLSLARNLRDGFGATADGIHLTNGFHPLYALLLVPLVQMAGENLDLGVHLALTLVAFLNVATAWPLACLGRILSGQRLGVVLALLYVLNPWAAVLTATGVESALFVLLAATTLAAYARWRIHPTTRHLLLVGLAAGFMIMARSEGGLLLGVLLLDLCFSNPARGQRTKNALLLLGTAALVCLPWATWSMANFGTPFQESSAAISMHTHAGAPEGLSHRAAWQLRRTMWHGPRFVVKSLIFGYPGVVLLAIVWISRRRTNGYERPTSPERAFLRIAGWAALATAIYYSVILLHQQHWYFNSVVLFTTVGLGILADRWLRSGASAGARTSVRRAVLVGILAYAAVTGTVWVRYLYPPDRYGQVNKYAVAKWIDGQGDRFAGRRFGASDSGVLAYFCRCSLTNLDGVVNSDVLNVFQQEGLTASTLARYVVTDGIELLPLPDTVDLGRWAVARLEAVQPIPNTGFTLYRVTARNDS